MLLHTRIRTFFCAAWVLLPALHIMAAPLSDEDRVEFFEKRIRPVLNDRCFECHGSEKVKGGLRLDTHEGLLKGGDSGPAMISGIPEKSLLIKAIRYQDKDLQMPPKHRIEPEQVANLEAWIRMGAPDPGTKGIMAPPSAGGQHWAFQPLKTANPPATRNKRWVVNDIDAFVLARLESKNLLPSPDAEKRALLRRVTYDLTGLPPTPAEVEAFLHDRSPTAFEAVVERLLASPRYGERWGRYWLDLARYSDTAGENADYPIPQAYKYRNYVIEAFNRDKPYDRFIREQIAGDLLPHSSEQEKREHIIATGFLAMARRFSVDPDTAQYLTIEDAIDTMSKSVMGLSMSCARCHDHKFDPIPTRDYYALYGIFQSTRFPFPGSENKKRQRDFVPLIPDEQAREITLKYSTELLQADAQIGQLEEEEKKLEGLEGQGKGPANKKSKPGKDFAKLIGQAKKQRSRLIENPPIFDSAYAVAEGKPGNARIQKRGEPGNLGTEVPRHFLSVLGGQTLPAGNKGSGRLELADWLVASTNPLTARVAVNRLWQHHFGKGLVQTASDFGLRGRPPTHPELLDYLAGRFIQNGWSMKALHKQILLSHTYQQESSDNPAGLATDPANEYLWKYNRQRLDAEALRDSLLALANDLDLSEGGPHPFPKEGTWNYTQHNAFTALYNTRQRSIYVMQQRIRKHPFFAVFDGADPNASTAERPVSTTPLQALFFMNDRFAHEQAEQFAERLLIEYPGPSERTRALYEWTFSRPPRREELNDVQKYLARFSERAAKLEISKDKQERMAWSSLVRAVFGSNELMFVD
jgi:hypothetical protein